MATEENTKTIETDDSFRDQLSTVNKEGKRNWIYPKKPSGRFYNARTLVSFLLLVILVGMPFIKVDGHQFMLFDFLNRNFILFGIPFGPHDLYLFVIAMIAIIVFVILFTAVFGRVFCGWACPQTIFMEMVFRKIEYWLEGDWLQQKQLTAAPWDSKKTIRKTAKYVIFFIISFFISNIFLSYLIGMDKLIKIITDPPSQHVEGLISILAFSGVFYWVFSYFREQACTIVCPYGRLQGVLLDRDSVVIAYDNVRGEPRGKIRKSEDQSNLGDCIDCHLCVDVCPTGIDIRNGIQLECVNCTACIDACDGVMDKVKRPRGLIRYASLNSIENNSKFRFTPRAVFYSILLVVLLGVLGYLLSARTDYDFNILRTAGMLYQKQADDKISNLYDVNIVNKTYRETHIQLKLENPEGELELIGRPIDLKPQEIYDGKFMIILDTDEIKTMNTPLKIGVYSNGQQINMLNTSFLGPVIKEHKDKEHDEKD